MAATITARGITWNTTAGNKSTGSFTPAANDLLVAIVGLTGTDSAPTMSDGQSGSWTLVDSFRSNNAGATGGLRIYVRNSAVTASSMTVTMTSPGGDTGGGLAVLSVSPVSAYGASAVRSSGGLADQTAGTTPAPVLSSTPLSTSAIISAVMDNTNGTANAVPRVGYSEHYDQGYNSPATGIEVNSRLSGETSATITYNGTTPTAYAVIAIEVKAADADAEVAWTEVEVPSLNADAEISWAEFEVPLVSADAEVSFTEFEVPFVNANAEISWAEFEVPAFDADGEVAFAEFEVPTANADAEISWVELEVPTADADAEISWVEFEVPFVDAESEISHAEVEVPFADGNAEVSWTEFEVPSVDGGSSRIFDEIPTHYSS